MALDKIVWKENSFVIEADGERVSPSPIGPIFDSYHPESLTYNDDVNGFLANCAEHHMKEAGLDANAFQGHVLHAANGADHCIIQLYKI
tara:strand:- start:882 stop:1148 length:267 start_codon:yes stop_codon:yes gene_type:complete